MAVNTIRKGLDLPITGAPDQTVSEAPKVRRVAVVAADYPGMRPKMAVQVGDEVKRGQLLFEDRKAEGVRHTAPGAGKVVAINRGEYRALQTVVIELTESEAAGNPVDSDFASFESYSGKGIAELTRDEVMALLVESGALTAFRMRPHGRVPSPGSDAPAGVFVTATDSNPLAPDVDAAFGDRAADFEAGLQVVAKLTEGKTFLCTKPGSRVKAGSAPGITEAQFAGPHPSGTVGYHIHTLLPVSRQRTVWHINYQDVISVGRLFKTGRVDVERVISLAGPTVKRPRLLQTRQGAELSPIVDGELADVENRVVSGSVLAGRTAQGEVLGFLGRYHLQVSALREGREREFLGWLTPGFEAFSTSGIYFSQLNKAKKFDFHTALNGSERAMVPIGMYERVFPFDILPTFLLRALLVKDLTRAETLGALELDEEDMALCTFVCPGKQDYGHVLRENLDQIWKEG